MPLIWREQGVTRGW